MPVSPAVSPSQQLKILYERSPPPPTPRKTRLVRALVACLVLICAEIFHGIPRGVFLVPHVGQFSSNQIGVFTGSVTYVGRQSYYEDPELELYLLGARYYDPQAGRFASEDPLRYQSDDINLYAYVHNNPVNATDPSGTGEVRGWLR